MIAARGDVETVVALMKLLLLLLLLSLVGLEPPPRVVAESQPQSQAQPQFQSQFQHCFDGGKLPQWSWLALPWPCQPLTQTHWRWRNWQTGCVDESGAWRCC